MIVFDAGDPLTHDERISPDLLYWIRENGVEIHYLYRLELLPDHDGMLRIFRFHTPDGSPHLHKAGPACRNCEPGQIGTVCRMEPYELPMIVPLPPELLRIFSRPRPGSS